MGILLPFTRVRKKVCKKKEIADIPDDVHCIQDSEIIEKQPILSNGEILAIESQDDVGRRKGKDEQGGSEHQDINATCTHEGTSTKKKRKDSDKSHSSKYYFVFDLYCCYPEISWHYEFRL